MVLKNAHTLVIGGLMRDRVRQTVTGIPVVLLASTYVFSGLLGLGPGLGSPAIVLTLLVAVPVGLGALVDVLYIPPPDEVELPETWE